MTPIAEQLTSLGLHHAATHLDDLSTKRRLGPLELIKLLVERARATLRPQLETASAERVQPTFGSSSRCRSWYSRTFASNSRSSMSGIKLRFSCVTISPVSSYA